MPVMAHRGSAFSGEWNARSPRYDNARNEAGVIRSSGG